MIFFVFRKRVTGHKKCLASHGLRPVFPLRFWCVSMCPKIGGFGMFNNGKVKNESARAQQKC